MQDQRNKLKAREETVSFRVFHAEGVTVGSASEMEMMVLI